MSAAEDIVAVFTVSRRARVRLIVHGVVTSSRVVDDLKVGQSDAIIKGGVRHVERVVAGPRIEDNLRNLADMFGLVVMVNLPIRFGRVEVNFHVVSLKYDFSTVGERGPRDGQHMIAETDVAGTHLAAFECFET